jgi:glycosyltransferase involved in cell wall biosynthesis
MNILNDEIKVAIWMVTYNHEKFIANAINSIINQKTNFRYKLFIGEDNSTDNTRNICIDFKLKYPEYIELHLNKNNIGSNANGINMYKVCFKSDSKYIALCEGDDYWTDPYKLQKQLDFLEANPEYVLCFHPIKILEPDGRIVADYITKVPENFETIETMAAKGNYIHTPSVLFRNIIEKWPEELFVSPIGDFFIYMFLGQYGKYGMVKDEMAVYRHQTGIWSKQHEQSRSLKTLLTLLLIYQSLNDTQNQIGKILINRINIHFRTLLLALSDDDLQQLRTSKVTSQLVDQMMLEIMTAYKNNQIENINNLTLIKVFIKRGLRIFK